MQQLELFDYRKDYLFERDNEVAYYYDILKENEDTISYSEHIDPKKKFSICGMDYEEYVDIKKKDLKGLDNDKILNFLSEFNKEHRLERYNQLLKFNDVKFEADVFTWCSD